MSIDPMKICHRGSAASRRGSARMRAIGAILAFAGIATTSLSPAVAQSVPADDRQVVLISRILVKSGEEPKFEAAIRDFYAAVARDEPGCLANIMYRPAPRPSATGGGKRLDVFHDSDFHGYTFYEVYRDQDASRAHAGTSHFKHFMAVAGPLIDGPIDLAFVREVARR